MSEGLFDVVEVDIETRKVLMMTHEPKSAHDAEAIKRMAIMRRATDKNFFATVPAGKYSDGDIYT